MHPKRSRASGLGRRFVGAAPASNTAGNRDLGSIPNPGWPVNSQHGQSRRLGTKKSQTGPFHGKSGKLDAAIGLISRNRSKADDQAGEQTRQPTVVLELFGILTVGQPVGELPVADLDADIGVGTPMEPGLNVKGI